jgi:hypothetical protein
MAYGDTLKNQNDFAQIALERARLRNLGNGVIAATNPGSVTQSNDMPSRAASGERNPVGSKGGE